MLAIHIIGSGSKGNCAIVEDRSTSHGVLVDCGICKRDVFARSEEAGFDLSNLDAILITHDHSDHTSKLGVVVRGLKRQELPLYVLPEVEGASNDIHEVEGSLDVRHMHVGTPFEAAGINVTPFATSHDAAGSCGFLFESADGDSIGYMTDTGFATDEAAMSLRGVRILAIEANHDLRMLQEGPYPRYLQDRIRSDRGHLSNVQSAEALSMLATGQLEHVVAMHISESNNLPSLAREALESALASMGHPAQVHVASQRRLVSVL